MHLARRIVIDAPAERVWAVLAHEFAGISAWASGVSHSASAATVADGPIGSGRVCQTFAGEVTETITRFDEAGRSMSYRAEGLPRFVAEAINNLSVIAEDANRSPTPPPSCEGAGTPAASAGTTFAVSAPEWAFAPGALRVAAGQEVTVHVTNDGTIPHTFTIGAVGADTGSLAAGATAELSFTAPAGAGTHEIICAFGGHAEAGMVGTLLVD